MFEPAVVNREAIERWWAKVHGAGGWWRRIAGRTLEHFADMLANAIVAVEVSSGLVYVNEDHGRFYVHVLLTRWPCSDDMSVLDWIEGRFRIKLSAGYPPAASLRRLAIRAGFAPVQPPQFATIPFYEGTIRCSIWERR